ncbi:hypothetical protein EC957_004521 [Mortierella hygrophila]|uniref:Uncharacterized protein n=1 Tax=Mortierella hygrophila TaxID=979708 RepID=A0A9P6FFU3_9FUNG|nr:hypothetical protein EC957_004521 [Mortierella hygrophila]
MYSQPYGDYVEAYEVSSRYSDAENDFQDNDDDGEPVADDSLAVASGDALSWSATPDRVEELSSANKNESVDRQSDQNEIVASTYPSRRSKHHTQSQASPEAEEEEEQEEEEEEEVVEPREESLSPEVDSEFEEQVESYNRKSTPSASPQSVGTRGALASSSKDIVRESKATATATVGSQTRGRRTPQLSSPASAPASISATPTRKSRRSFPDDVKRQLNKDTIDLLLQNPHMSGVLLSVDIPIFSKNEGYTDNNNEGYTDNTNEGYTDNTTVTGGELRKKTRRKGAFTTASEIVVLPATIIAITIAGANANAFTATAVGTTSAVRSKVQSSYKNPSSRILLGSRG